MPLTVRDMVAKLKRNGWFEVRQAGSHRQFHHPTKSGTVTVPGEDHKTLKPGTENNIRKQAGWK